MPTETTQQVFEVNHLCQLSRQETRTVQGWIERGYVAPLNGRKPGKGTRRQFNRAAAFAIAVGGALKRAGIDNQAIRKATRFLESADLPSHFARGERYLVANRRQVFIASGDAVFAHQRGRPAAVAVFDLQRAVKAFDRLTSEMSDETNG